MKAELKTERFQFMLDKSTIFAVDDWMFKNRIRGRGEAMRQLIQRGLVSAAAENEKADAQRA